MSGRVNLVARGVKRRKDNLGLILQPGRKLNLSWSIRGELGTLISAEADGYGFRPAGTGLIACFYMNELLVRMLHRDEAHPELFTIYEKSLREIEKGHREDRVLRIFETHLLKSLGYGLILDHDVETGEKIQCEENYFYKPDSGPVRQKPPGAGYTRVSGKTLIALHEKVDWDERISREAKELLRMILSAYTGDKPLGSRALYRAYLQNTQPV
jgi:DNA repair protein RecO (recombination protein O)